MEIVAFTPKVSWMKFVLINCFARQTVQSFHGSWAAPTPSSQNIRITRTYLWITGSVAHSVPYCWNLLTGRCFFLTTLLKLLRRRLSNILKEYTNFHCSMETSTNLGVGTPRNVMLLKNGDVKWIDFEHSMLGASVEKLEFEMAIVKETIGPQGLLWRRRYVFWLSTTWMLLNIVRADRVCPTMRKKTPALTITKAIPGNIFTCRNTGPGVLKHYGIVWRIRFKRQESESEPVTLWKWTNRRRSFCLFETCEVYNSICYTRWFCISNLPNVQCKLIWLL